MNSLTAWARRSGSRESLSVDLRNQRSQLDNSQYIGAINVLFQIEFRHPLVSYRLEESSLMRLTTRLPPSCHLSLPIFYLGLGFRRSVHISSLDRPRKVRPQPVTSRKNKRTRLSDRVIPAGARSHSYSPPRLIRFLLLFRQNSLGPNLRPSRVKQRLFLPMPILVIHD
jgi:hypothetical protein